MKFFGDIVPPSPSRRAALRSQTGLSGRLARFSEDEAGNLTIMSVFMFIGITAICGVGVDLMMNETERTRLQNSLDSAVLAAANITQERDAETVVNDYMSAHGMGSALGMVDAERTYSESRVMAQAAKTTESLFGDVIGVDQLRATAIAEAENAVGNVEISMVLDVSGSMGWGVGGGSSESKNQALRRAANTFVDTVLDPTRGGLTSVNLVSYDSYTNIGPHLADELLSGPDRCYHFRNRDFNTLEISFSEYDVDDAQGARSRYPRCNFTQTEDITVHQNNADALRGQIAELGASGWTAIEVGMKWGLAFLDPSTNDVVRSMVSRGQTPAGMSDRPAAYNDPQTNKYVVLMTDGDNTVHSRQDQQLAHICGLARDQGIVIFGVAFAAPAAGVAAMRSCASSDAHFFNVQGTDIEEAFAAIAASITQLKLTQ